MSKLKFAKIFEVGDYQVLITKEYEQEDKNDAFKVVQTTDLEDVHPSLAMGFTSLLKRNECFENYNIENAQKFLESIKSMLGV